MRGRGGYVDNAVFENLEIIQVSEQAIQINMFCEASTVIPKSNSPSDFKNIVVRNISGISAGTGIEIKGLPEHKLRNISLENIRLSAGNAFFCDNVENLSMKNVEIRPHHRP